MPSVYKYKQHEAMMNQSILTLENARAELLISRTHLWNLIRSGKLKAFKVGRCVRITRGEIDRFISANQIS
ncbi:helix-turn-helix domain-containing protein [Thalassotalea psychrophila]|uniref:helix-turn-helix domain-containing protein n=1 Tax=Thalassotalea psychrophila TaxID=3065647 RepID=UPI0038655D72